MKIKIQKLSGGNIRVELTPSVSKRPIVVELTPDRVAMLIQMLTMAGSMDVFDFSLSL